MLIELDVADTPSKRMIGLLKTKELLETKGLFIPNCRAIHTFGMQYSIDVVFINKQLKIIKVIQSCLPNRLAWSFESYSVIELKGGFCIKWPSYSEIIYNSLCALAEAGVITKYT